MLLSLPPSSVDVPLYIPPFPTLILYVPFIVIPEPYTRPPEPPPPPEFKPPAPPPPTIKISQVVSSGKLTSYSV